MLLDEDTVRWSTTLQSPHESRSYQTEIKPEKVDRRPISARGVSGFTVLHKTKRATGLETIWISLCPELMSTG